MLLNTVMDIVFGTGHCFWDSRYLCHFSTEMAEILFPGTFSKGVWTHKISALYLLYFHSYETFSDLFSDFHTETMVKVASGYLQGKTA